MVVGTRRKRSEDDIQLKNLISRRMKSLIIQRKKEEPQNPSYLTPKAKKHPTMYKGHRIPPHLLHPVVKKEEPQNPSSGSASPWILLEDHQEGEEITAGEWEYGESHLESEEEAKKRGEYAAASVNRLFVEALDHGCHDIKGEDSWVPIQYTPCRYHFCTTGGCTGLNCGYSHEDSGVNWRLAKKVWKKGRCKFWERGKCKHGEACPWVHDGGEERDHDEEETATTAALATVRNVVHNRSSRLCQKKKQEEIQKNMEDEQHHDHQNWEEKKQRWKKKKKLRPCPPTNLPPPWKKEKNN